MRHGTALQRTLRTVLQKAIFIGIAVTIASAVFSFALPSVPNYIFLPGMMVVYVLSGSVHGFSSGVYLPTLPVRHALGGIVIVFIYSVLAFAALRYWLQGRKKRSL